MFIADGFWERRRSLVLKQRTERTKRTKRKHWRRARKEEGRKLNYWTRYPRPQPWKNRHCIKRNFVLVSLNGGFLRGCGCSRKGLIREVLISSEDVAKKDNNKIWWHLPTLLSKHSCAQNEKRRGDNTTSSLQVPLRPWSRRSFFFQEYLVVCWRLAEKHSPLSKFTKASWRLNCSNLQMNHACLRRVLVCARVMHVRCTWGWHVYYISYNKTVLLMSVFYWRLRESPLLVDLSSK